MGTEDSYIKSANRVGRKICGNLAIVKVKIIKLFSKKGMRCPVI